MAFENKWTNKKPWFVIFASFCGSDTSTVVNFRLPVWCHWMQWCHWFGKRYILYVLWVDKSQLQRITDSMCMCLCVYNTYTLNKMSKFTCLGLWNLCPGRVVSTSVLLKEWKEEMWNMHNLLALYFSTFRFLSYLLQTQTKNSFSPLLVVRFGDEK